jgi:hypothetical protein
VPTSDQVGSHEPCDVTQCRKNEAISQSLERMVIYQIFTAWMVAGESATTNVSGT